jgi:hypothetical protein
MQSKQIKQKFLQLIFKINILVLHLIEKFFHYLVDHFIIFETPKNEYKIRKNEFHKPTNAYVCRKSN